MEVLKAAGLWEPRASHETTLAHSQWCAAAADQCMLCYHHLVSCSITWVDLVTAHQEQEIPQAEESASPDSLVQSLILFHAHCQTLCLISHLNCSGLCSCNSLPAQSQELSTRQCSPPEGDTSKSAFISSSPFAQVCALTKAAKI